MKKYSLMILAVLALATGCSKEESENLEISAEGKITGKINGVDVGPSKIFSDVQVSGSSEVMYITAKTDFESFTTPTTNGKQFLVRIQPYTGVGKYTTHSQGFWVYTDNITFTDPTKPNYKLHGNTDTKGNMNLEITSDKLENGKRVIRGKFSGESGRTLQVTNGAQTEIALETFKITNIEFIAPPK